MTTESSFHDLKHQLGALFTSKHEPEKPSHEGERHVPKKPDPEPVKEETPAPEAEKPKVVVVPPPPPEPPEEKPPVEVLH